MSRKSSFWKSRGGKSRKARHGWQKRSYTQPAMSLERLEDRYMLAADVLIKPNQFFGQNTNATVSAYEAPFRVNFTDVYDQADEDAGFHFYQASIDWGDGSPLEFSGTPNPPNDEGASNIGVVTHTFQDPFIGHSVVGDAITGRIEGRHNYAATGQYTVTVTLFDSSGDDSAPLSSIVNVYPVDNSLSISADGVVPHVEPYIIPVPGRTDRAVGDITEQQPYTFTLDGSAGINQNISSWTISWGDSIETFDGNPSSAVHAYGNFHDFTYPGDEGGGSHPESHVIISAAVIGENGTYVVHSIEYDIHDALPVASVEPDSVDVSEGAPYTLNFSYVDPSAPVQYWLVLWGDEPEDATFDDLTILSGDTTSATHYYADGEADYFPQAIPINTEGQSVVGFALEAHVLNVDPTASFSGGGMINEGSAAGVVAFSDQLDPSAADTLAGFHYAYDFDNDGTFDVGDGSYDGSGSDTSQPIPASFLADGDGTYNIIGRIIDKDGGFTDYTAAIVVLNVAPTASFSGGGSVNEGSAAGVVAFGDQLDPSTADSLAGFHYAYDFNNDGIFDVGDGTYGGSGTATSQPVPASFLADGDATYNIKGRIIDKDGGFTDYTAAIIVLNVAPTLTVSGSASVNEGSSYTLNLSSMDPGADTIDHWTINWGDGTQIVAGNPSSVTHTYADGSASYTISATATDEDGTFNADNTVSVTVNNVAPTLAINGAASVNEGSTYTLNLSKSDPGADTISQWTINWGDGTQVVAGSPASVTHVYADGPISPINYTISATATDEDGTFAAGNTVAVTVQNVAPTANAGGPYATFDDAPITLTGSGTDPAGAADPLTFMWDLDGDGNFGETGSGATRGNEVGANVTYNPTGLPTSTQTVKLQVSDGDGGVTVATTTVQILGQGTLAIGGVLYIVGSNTANDIVLITQFNNTITVLATFNSNNPMTFNASTITDIQVRMRGGNDIVVTTSNVMQTMTIDGGAGNDLLTGGGGRNVIIGGTGNDILYGAAGDDVLLGGDGNDDLLGGDGNDVLVGGNGNDILDGGNGRDLLIGSQDNDCLSGGNDEDILIGGYTVHDNNVAALDSIMAIWDSSASFSSRVATLSGSGGLLQAGTKVFDDDDHDQLVGDAGRDLYFGDNNPSDHVTDSISLQALQDQLIAVT